MEQSNKLQSSMQGDHFNLITSTKIHLTYVRSKPSDEFKPSVNLNYLHEYQHRSNNLDRITSKFRSNTIVSHILQEKIFCSRKTKSILLNFLLVEESVEIITIQSSNYIFFPSEK